MDFQSAREALTLLPRLATLILQVIEAFRFRVNLGEGKTEALVHLCGTGASAAKKHLLAGTPGIVAADGRVIRVVAEYKYLGVPQRASDNGRRDIEAAAGRGRGVWSQAASLVPFARPALAPEIGVASRPYPPCRLFLLGKPHLPPPPGP